MDDTLSRGQRTIASDLLVSGWLPPNAAAERLGITVRQLEDRFRRGEVRRKPMAPGMNLYLYEVTGR